MKLSITLLYYPRKGVGVRGKMDKDDPRIRRKKREEKPYRQHPSCIFNFMWIWFDISMIESTPIMHVNLVIILEMRNKAWDVTWNRALGSCIRAIVWAESTVLLMLGLAIVWENVLTAKTLVCAGEFHWFSYFLQSQTPYISKIIVASWATILHSNLAVWT